ncbi:DUF4145 domain-containing protein [Ralstonia wenshanensis]|uniref:DUF4145 domain-containing protein n=1 Tax=Ralstonia wenshanensis TaxID=2842456 RepID=UPI001E396A8F|nr:DUF4145 domain-containing protein [Ralstonia wenshanensis]UGS89777.1 DUF4145 domain-containing protein [Ralstonia wenshanensis]
MAEQLSLEIQQQVGEQLRSHCVTCKRDTNHTVVCSAHQENFLPDDNAPPEWAGGVTWRTDHQIVRCNGCDTVGYRRVVEDDSDGETYISQFPQPGPDLETLRESWHLPQDVNRIHFETLTALTHRCPTLAGIGIRLLIEIVCKGEGVEGRNLAERIDALADKGIVAKASAQVLHHLRDLGNGAAHEAKAFPLNQLVLAMDIVQTMLKNVYLHPQQAAAFAKKA